MARSLERRLERLLESVAGRVFSGRLHPSEIAGRLAREADFARFDHETGPATANSFLILVHPRDLTMDPEELEQTLVAEMSLYAAQEGLRLEGPVSVSIEPSGEVPPGKVVCHVEVAPGPTPLWARLVSDGATLEIRHNRVLIGRSSQADLVLLHDDISRRHALLWREGGQTWIRDLGSANGTSVDGRHLGQEAGPVASGSMVAFSGHRYRFMETSG